ncbi:MAG: hypothetical protein PHS17_16875, partial [Desulfobacterales bacterium]|nr:hypothetical protein [Desulfobacterales bacterium]
NVAGVYQTTDKGKAPDRWIRIRLLTQSQISVALTGCGEEEKSVFPSAGLAGKINLGVQYE